MGNNEQIKETLIAEIKQKVEDRILEENNYELLKKLINRADNINEAMAIAELGTMYEKTGLKFDVRLEKMSNDIKYFQKNKNLSFHFGDTKPTHKLIIGDNYDALQNLLIEYKNKIDVIYIDPPYGKDSMGEFAATNYKNNITRDNLLSMLYPRLQLAKQLLSSEGVIFCSIDDKNQAYVKCLFDKVFGEFGFLLNIARITKKGGKSTSTIAKNNDYIIGYTKNIDIIFSQEEKTNLSKYKYEDEFVKTRGKYALTQTLDYNSLQYSSGMDYEIVINDKVFIPGGDVNKRNERLSGKHGKTDWVWRWSKEAVEWGKKMNLFVVKNNRIYTKSYLNCRKKNGKCELEMIDATKVYTTLSFLDNKYSNDNAKKEFDSLFENGSSIFKNPKPTSLIFSLIKMVNESPSATILDFFAGSGTTGHAVLEMNKEDNGNRTFILCQMDEKTETTPKGIATEVTAERLKRIMTGEGYKGEKDFKWIKDNEPYKENLDVYDIKTVANFEQTEGKTAFDVIDEELYGKEKFSTVKEKVEWVANNFANTQMNLESKEDWQERQKGE